MDRVQFENAIRQTNEEISKASLIQFIAFMVWLKILLIFAVFDPFEINENNSNVLLFMWVVSLVLLIYYGNHKEKFICKANQLICGNCNKVYNPNDYLEILLENQCQSCKEKVYET